MCLAQTYYNWILYREHAIYLPLHQDHHLLGSFVTRTAAYHYMKEALTAAYYLDLQIVGGLVTRTAAYHYIKIFTSWSFSTPTAAYHYIKIFNY